GSQQCRRLILYQGSIIRIRNIPLTVRQLLRIYGSFNVSGNQPMTCENGAEVIIEEDGSLNIESP
ncbi:MAG: hypothetical protein H7X99_10200, partial [Saprospiraceae bacterium]|nr:hypothetical protein [Saprospiraceae bacterium]